MAQKCKDCKNFIRAKNPFFGLGYEEDSCRVRKMLAGKGSTCCSDYIMSIWKKIVNTILG